MIEVEWSNLKAPELRRLAEADAIVIVPVASIEQHGPHLPVQVDTLLVGNVARQAALLITTTVPVVVTPTVWHGLAEHHMAFGGTITLDFETFQSVLRCICRSLLRQNFRRILILNGHGGNIAALQVIAAGLAIECGTPIAAATYWMLEQAAKAFVGILQAQSTVQHACEAETSMMLYLRPDLVDTVAMASLQTEPGRPRAPGTPYVWQSFAEITTSGVIGAASAATAEKGAQLLAEAANALATVLTSGQVWPNASS